MRAREKSVAWAQMDEKAKSGEEKRWTKPGRSMGV